MSSSYRPRSSLHRVIERVEEELAMFYCFDLQSRAVDHLVDFAELKLAVGEGNMHQSQFLLRGGVFLNTDQAAEEVFIGIYLSDGIVDQLHQHDPTVALSNQNLDGFSVLIEELSHFHLLLNRFRLAQQVTMLELELQGEIDKLLVAALILREQCGDSHILPLARRLYDQSQIIGADTELYWQATKYAARFWFAVAHSGQRVIGPELRSKLRHAYREPIWQKLRAS